MDPLLPENIVSILRAVEVMKRPSLLRLPPSERTTMREYAKYLVDRTDIECDDGADPSLNWLVAMDSSHTAMADFIMNPDRQLFTRVRWYQDFLRSIVENNKEEGGVSGEQINLRAWCDLRQTCRKMRDAIDSAGLGNAYFCLSFEDWVELQLLLVRAKFGERCDDNSCYFVQNPEEYICEGALKMLENMLHLSVLKSIQNHPSSKVRENATKRFLANNDTRAAILMMSGIIMGSTEGCESVSRTLDINRDRCTNCCAPIEITSLGRPNKRKMQSREVKN